MATTSPTFPKSAVRIVREAYGENQTQFALRLGVSQGAVARWENESDSNSPSGPAAILLEIMAKKKKIEITQ